MFVQDGGEVMQRQHEATNVHIYRTGVKQTATLMHLFLVLLPLVDIILAICEEEMLENASMPCKLTVGVLGAVEEQQVGLGEYLANSNCQLANLIGIGTCPLKQIAVTGVLALSQITELDAFDGFVLQNYKLNYPLKLS